LKGGIKTGTSNPSVYENEAKSTAGLPFRENVPQVTATTWDQTPAGQAQLARYDVQSPQTAVLAGLADLGYDPASPIPAVRGLVESADAINQAYLIQSVLSGTGPITDPNARSIDYANFVRGVIARGGNTRSMASTATRNLGAARARLEQLAGTPEGQLAFKQDKRLEAALGAVSGQNAVKTLADLAGATYSLPGDKGQLEAAQRRLQTAATRAAGRGTDVMDYLTKTAR